MLLRVDVIFDRIKTATEMDLLQYWYRSGAQFWLPEEMY